MLTLRSSPNSPFARKIRIALAVLGLEAAIVPSDTKDPADSLRQQNPLGKVPTLLLDDGEALFDSRVIAEYLDFLDGRGILLRSGMERILVQRLQALADGMTDAAVLQLYESRYRPAEHHSEKWLDHQRGKVQRSLAALEANAPSASSAQPHIGEIALACGLSFLDSRFDGTWRRDHPLLVRWLIAFEEAVPAFGDTRPVV